VSATILHCHHTGPSYCLEDDDFIGRARLDFSMSELEAALPTVGAEYVETVTLFPCPYGQDTCGDPPHEYTFTYRITRWPDVTVDLRNVLDEAMSKIGAHTELEAFVAGLRSLRAPSPRKIVTKAAVNLAPGG
jgi:hypothetical protein